MPMDTGNVKRQKIYSKNNIDNVDNIDTSFNQYYNKYVKCNEQIATSNEHYFFVTSREPPPITRQNAMNLPKSMF